MFISVVVFINMACIGQDLTDISMKVNDKLRIVGKQIDSLKNIQTSLEKELDSIKILEFNKKKITELMKSILFCGHGNHLKKEKK